MVKVKIQNRLTRHASSKSEKMLDSIDSKSKSFINTNAFNRDSLGPGNLIASSNRMSVVETIQQTPLATEKTTATAVSSNLNPQKPQEPSPKTDLVKTIKSLTSKSKAHSRPSSASKKKESNKSINESLKVIEERIET